MKSNFFIGFAVVILAIQACKDKESIVNNGSNNQTQNDLILNMKKDTLVQNYNNTVDSLFKNVLYNKHNLSRLDENQIQKEFRKLSLITNKGSRLASGASIMDKYADIYSDAGMKNSKEYISLISNMIFYKVRIENKYPQIRTLAPIERRNLYKILHDGTRYKVDMRRAKEQRIEESKSVKSKN